MHPIYNLAKMICSLILIIMMLRLAIDLGESYVEYFSRANSRMIQEYVSGFISISNFAPSQFNVNNTFPEVSHVLQILENPPVINISSGKTAKVPRIVFRPYPPLGYIKTSTTKLEGDCINKRCEFSGENLNNIVISKDTEELKISYSEIERK